MTFNKTSLQHLLKNKQNIEQFTCNKLKDILNIYNYDFAYINKLAYGLLC